MDLDAIKVRLKVPTTLLDSVRNDCAALVARVEELEWERGVRRTEYADRVRDVLDETKARVTAEAERDRLNALINTPQTADFLEAVRIEAAHQRDRWGDEHDERKSPQDWFWLIGYVAGKAIRPGTDKLLHHIITTAAVCLNWHRLETRAVRAEVVTD